MADKSLLSAQDFSELLDINSPGLHEPGPEMINAAAREVPRLLTEMAGSPPLAESHQETEEWVAAHRLAAGLESAGHSDAAMAWALYRLAERGFLEGEVRSCRSDAEQKALMSMRLEVGAGNARIVNSHLGLFPGGLALPPRFLEPSNPTTANTAVSFDSVSEFGVTEPVLPEQQGVAPKGVNVSAQEVTKSKATAENTNPPIYYLAIRPTAGLWDWQRSSPGATLHLPTSQQPVLHVVLGARHTEPILVYGRRKSLTRAQYHVIKALVAAWPNPLTKDELVSQSGHTDAVNILKRIAEIDEDWEGVIHLAGKTGGGYGLK